MRRERLAIAQGMYYVATGLWPLASLSSFEVVTGPKLEGWLVKTVGLSIANIGALLAVAGFRRNVSAEVRGLGMAAALTYAGIDLWYAGLRRRIPRIYLADAAVELVLAGAWLLSPQRQGGRAAARPPLARRPASVRGS